MPSHFFRNLLLLILLLLGGNIPTNANETSGLQEISAQDHQALLAHVGRDAAVEGIVVSVGRTSSDKIRFLDLTDNTTSGFVAALFPVVFNEVGEIEKWIGQKVRITGSLEKYKEKTQIKIFNAKQIQILPATEPTNAPEKKEEP
jgi:DNA/RNA endonuclease YhcR with UshA esterase domain